MRLNLKLKSVMLENFRLFEKLEMDFHPQLTVLIGENGAGKTSLMDGLTKLLTPLPQLIEKFHHLSMEEKDTTRRSLFKRRDITLGKDELFCKLVLSHSQSDEPLIIESHRMNKKNFEALRHQVYFHGEEFLSKLREKRALGLLNSTPILVYYPCEKVDNESSNGEEKEYSEKDIFNAYDNALNARAFDFPRFFEWYKWQEDREARGQGSPLLNVVRKAILTMLNDEGEEEKFKRIFIDVSRFKNYQLMLQKGEAELEVSQLSGGEKSLFALVSDIARRLAIANPDSEDPLREGGGIVLIDEIDLHLHPRWQRKVITKLTEIFPNLQFIITTHSPLILGSVRSENIRLLDEGKVYSVPETFGQNVGVIVKRIMGVEESMFEEEISRIFRHLAKNQVEEAKTGIAAIEKKSPADIPALREAKAVLKRKEILAE